MITEFYHGVLMTHSEIPNTTRQISKIPYLLSFIVWVNHTKFHNMPKYSLLGLRAILKWKLIFCIPCGLE